MDANNEKLQKLQSKLRKAKDSKRSLKRKLKMKFAQRYLKLKTKLDSEKEKVRKLKTAAVSNKSLASTFENVSTNKSAGVNRIVIEDEFDHIEQMDEDHYQLNDGISGENIENDVDRFDIQYIHSYAKSYGEECSKMYFFCSTCKFKTTKKSNLKKHEEESCQRKPVREKMCPVCRKQFTYDGLRCHLRHFATAKHNAKNEHGKYTPREHQMMLQQLKEKKNKN